MEVEHLKKAISYNKDLKKYLIRIPETLNVNDQIAAEMRKNIRAELFDNFVKKLDDILNKNQKNQKIKNDIIDILKNMIKSGNTNVKRYIRRIST